MYNDSNQGRKPLPFAMAEKLDNAIDATTVRWEERLVMYCQTTAHATHFSTYCTPCQPLI